MKTHTKTPMHPPVGARRTNYDPRVPCTAPSIPALPVAPIVCHACDRLAKRVKNQRWQLSQLIEIVKRKNLELDALHFVWCDGNCERGMHRHGGELTHEIVDEAVRNTSRLVSRWEREMARRAKAEMSPVRTAVLERARLSIARGRGETIPIGEYLAKHAERMRVATAAQMDTAAGPTCGCGAPSELECGLCVACADRMRDEDLTSIKQAVAEYTAAEHSKNCASPIDAWRSLSPDLRSEALLVIERQARLDLVHDALGITDEARSRQVLEALKVAVETLRKNWR